MTTLIYLEVPFEDKEKVKSLGAKWHSDRKKWFIPSELNSSAFSEWIPEYETELTSRAIAPFYLLRAKEECWKCSQASEVITFSASGIEGETSENVKFEYITVLSERVKAFVGQYYKNYFMDYSNTTESFYYINHCQYCKATLGDFYLHSEPDHAFFPQSESEAAHIEVIELKNSGFVKISATQSMGIIDFILENGTRSVFKKSQ